MRADPDHEHLVADLEREALMAASESLHAALTSAISVIRLETARRVAAEIGLHKRAARD